MYFINHYECPGNLEYRKQHAPIKWEAESDCMDDDKCEICNCELTPVTSDEIEEGE